VKGSKFMLEYKILIKLFVMNCLCSRW